MTSTVPAGITVGETTSADGTTISCFRHGSRPALVITHAIAGYTVLNDVTARDFQYRSVEWLQGKTFERSTPVGQARPAARATPASRRATWPRGRRWSHASRASASCTTR